MFGAYSFLVYMLIFTIVPITVIWWKNYRFLAKNKHIIGMVVGLSLAFQLISDPFAEVWGAWFYTKEKTLDIWTLNFPIENTIFMILIAIAISSSVLSFIHYREKI